MIESSSRILSGVRASDDYLNAFHSSARDESNKWQSLEIRTESTLVPEGPNVIDTEPNRVSRSVGAEPTAAPKCCAPKER